MSDPVEWARSVAALVKQHVRSAVDAMSAELAELTKRVADLETRAPIKGLDGDKGDKGDPGKSITLDDVLPVLKSMQAEWALDFERRAQALFQKAVEAIPKPKDGKDGTNGIGWDDMQVEFDGKRTVTLKWVKGDTTHEAPIVFPLPVDVGFWKEGMTAEKGDGVTHGGSYWIAQKDTTVKPELGSDAWRLAVRKGRDGKRD